MKKTLATLALVLAVALGAAQKPAERGVYKDYRARGVIYERTDPYSGKKYVGQAWDEERFKERVDEHNKKLERERGKGAHYEFKIVSRPLQAELDMVEQAYIRKNGGIERDGGPLENKRNQVKDYEAEREKRIRESERERTDRRDDRLDRDGRRISERRMEEARREQAERRARLEREQRERRERERREREKGRKG